VTTEDDVFDTHVDEMFKKPILNFVSATYRKLVGSLVKANLPDDGKHLFLPVGRVIQFSNNDEFFSAIRVVQEQDDEAWFYFYVDVKMLPTRGKDGHVVSVMSSDYTIDRSLRISASDSPDFEVIPSKRRLKAILNDYVSKVYREPLRKDVWQKKMPTKPKEPNPLWESKSFL
jgi:hypothetical protein